MKWARQSKSTTKVNTIVIVNKLLYTKNQNNLNILLNESSFDSHKYMSLNTYIAHLPYIFSVRHALIFSLTQIFSASSSPPDPISQMAFDTNLNRYHNLSIIIFYTMYSVNSDIIQDIIFYRRQKRNKKRLECEPPFRRAYV